MRSSLPVCLVVCFAMGCAATTAQKPATQNTFNVGQTYHGFKLVDKRQIDEIDGVGLLFEHVKSGARLVKYETGDNNKAFSIVFKTPPEGDYGIPHILEHAVLQGSKKFPVKSPFMTLGKGSLNTFLNAMTASDFTMYPVASTNTKDFFNLVDVYLDAVFNPLIYDDPRILQQEGWRYELASAEAELTVNGVVVNEMKGAFSAPERILYRKMSKVLFPNSPYGMSAGGDPEAIPFLDHERVLAFHKRFYRPVNSYISLWGDGNTMTELAFIHDNYLQSMARTDVDASFPQQKPSPTLQVVETNYPIAKNEDPKGKSYLTLGWVGGDVREAEVALAMDVLADVLVNIPGGVVRQALQKVGLGKDVYASYDNTKQGVFTIAAKNVEQGQQQAFREVVFGALAKAATDGLDARQVEGVINKLEFQVREADYGSFPPGLVKMFWAARPWLFGVNPLDIVAYEKTLAKVRSGVSSQWLEKLIRQHLLNNAHAALVVASPRAGLQEEMERTGKQRLVQKKKEMGPEKIAALVESTQALKVWQQTPDAAADVAKIPMLELSDLNVDERRLEVQEKEIAGVRVLHYERPTNGIVYLHLAFDARVVSQERVPYLPVLASALGELSTQGLDYNTLNTEFNIHTGGMSFDVDVLSDAQGTDAYWPYFVAEGKVLTPKMPKLLELGGEVLLRTRFDDQERLADVMNRVYARSEGMARRAGIQLASRRLASYLKPMGAYNEQLWGVSQVRFVAELTQKMRQSGSGLGKDLAHVAKVLMNRNNLTVAVTCSKEDYLVVEQHLPSLLKTLPGGPVVKHKFERKAGKRNEGLLAASKVQYVTQGADLRALGHAYSGRLQVLQQILSTDYLHEAIRVQGGAYGSWAQFSRTGFAMFGSYRDPNVAETFEAYAGATDYLRTFDANERDMTRYIIGVIAKRDKPMSPRLEGRVATSRFMRGLKHEVLQNERNDILQTSVADLRAFAPMIQAMLKENTFCVYGNEDKLKAEKKRFRGFVRVLD